MGLFPMNVGGGGTTKKLLNVELYGRGASSSSLQYAIPCEQYSTMKVKVLGSYQSSSTVTFMKQDGTTILTLPGNQTTYQDMDISGNDYILFTGAAINFAYMFTS